MEMTYRLEFNETQQKFHLDNGTHEENTHGWFTIFEHCTDLEFHVYESFVNRVPKEKLTKEYLLKCAEEVKGFTNNLLEYGLVIPAKCNNGEKVPNHSKSPTQVALEVATNQLAEAMDIIDGYLNAGTKDQRKALSGRAKELYRDYYGVYFQNYRDRNKSSNTP